ncbi:MAG: hypothetical protein RIC15_10350 [Vicingaceae bacterium]
MTSRRMLKKKVNAVMNDIIEECYSIQISHAGRVDTESNKIIEDAVALFNDLLHRINSANKIEKRKELKDHFDAIHSDLEKNSLKLLERMNKL